jgi:hypothetical protein
MILFRVPKMPTSDKPVASGSLALAETSTTFNRSALNLIDLDEVEEDKV